MVEALVPKYFRKETGKLGLIPVSQPRVTDLHVHEANRCVLRPASKSCPTIKVEGYKELRAEKAEVAVTDEEVEESLKSMREQHATFTAIEGRPLADGDFAQVFARRRSPKDGDEASPVHMDEVLVEIGGKTHHAGIHRESARSFRGR